MHAFIFPAIMEPTELIGKKSEVRFRWTFLKAVTHHLFRVSPTNFSKFSNHGWSYTGVTWETFRQHVKDFFKFFINWGVWLQSLEQKIIPSGFVQVLENPESPGISENIFQAWKVLEFLCRSWKVLEICTWLHLINKMNKLKF